MVRINVHLASVEHELVVLPRVILGEPAHRLEGRLSLCELCAQANNLLEGVHIGDNAEGVHAPGRFCAHRKARAVVGLVGLL